MKAPLGELAQAFRQLEVLFNAGVPLGPALSSVARGGWSPALTEGLAKLQVDLYNGHSLSGSLRRHPEVADGTVIGLVRAGEQTGRLHQSLRLVSELLEREVRLRGRLRAALTYPLLVASCAALGVFGMMTFFLPRMADLALPARGLPGWLATLLTVLKLALNPWVVAAVAETLLGFGILFYYWSRTETGRALLDRAALSVPVLRRLVVLSGVARFCHTLSLMLGCGAPLLDSLELAPASLGNRELAASVRRATLRLVERGDSLAASFRPEPWFGATFVALVSVGEESARLDTMLAFLARIFEEDFELCVDSFTALIEPLMLGFLGVVVAGCILILFIPLSQMAAL